MSLSYTIIQNDDGTANVALYLDGKMLVARNDHPNYKQIVGALSSNDESADFVRLFDTGEAVKERFQALSERVSVENGHILLDGDPLDDSLTQQIVRFLDEGIEDWRPLVAFLENVTANPSEHSKTQLYDWITCQEGITITSDGLIVGYKGVRKNQDGALVSGYSGKATVQRPGEDPEVIVGQIPNEVGYVVTMPRSEVVHDPAATCHRGLHVGTQSYARDYANGAMLEVHVNPRDVVSVPSDARGEKIRVCRYTVVKVLDADFRYKSALRPDDEYEPLDDDPQDSLVGSRVTDYDGDEGVIVEEDGVLSVKYDDPIYGTVTLDDAWTADVTEFDQWDGRSIMFLVLDGPLVEARNALSDAQDDLDDAEDAYEDARESGGAADADLAYADVVRAQDAVATAKARVDRIHGKGGKTSQAAKGRGRNPAQDDQGKFSAGRPGSERGKDGRFSA